MRAIRDISAGEELCISYIDLYQTRKASQQELQATKHFTCTCSRCSEPMQESIDRFIEGVTCSACGNVLITSNANQLYKCEACGKKENAQVVSEVLQAVCDCFESSPMQDI